MRVLITGAAGMLGAALGAKLCDLGDKVYGLDDLSAGDPASLDPRITFTRGDVRDVPRLWSLLADVDIVYHLAARVSVQESILYPVEYNAVNTGGTVSVMAAARDAGVRRVVLVSSGAVYGEQANQPIVESAQPRPANPYAVSKLAAEHYVRAIGDLYRIETVVLRVFNAYGARHNLPPAHPPVISHFARQILTGGSIVLHGSPIGAQTRDFVHVDDVVEAMAAAGKTAGIGGRILNIGCGRECSVRELVLELERVTGRQARVLESTEHSGGAQRMCAAIDAARDALGWQPSVELRAGLSGLIADLRREQARRPETALGA